MVCQICGEKSGFYPLCKSCNSLKEDNKISKCNDCGIWKEDNKPLCYDCWLEKQRNEKRASKTYIFSEEEKEDNDFRNKFPAKIRADDGHLVRSRAEKIIDDWLYRNGIVHCFERKVPLEEEIYCDFFIPNGNIWIEFWGKEDEKYLKRKEIKKRFYKSNKKNLIELNNEDIEKLDDVLPPKLMKFSKLFNFN